MAPGFDNAPLAGPHPDREVLDPGETRDIQDRDLQHAGV